MSCITNGLVCSEPPTTEQSDIQTKPDTHQTDSKESNTTASAQPRHEADVTADAPEVKDNHISNKKKISTVPNLQVCAFFVDYLMCFSMLISEKTGKRERLKPIIVVDSINITLSI